MKTPQGKAHGLIPVMSVMCGQINSSLNMSWNKKKISIDIWIRYNENGNRLSKIVSCIQISLV